ncbi:hypothetical protein V7128_07375 [Neobacillus vireti]|uniref:hypothetical protein n=1 Tax=Neobacillus vireti TaxID=220686 RepID=UPI002FFDCE16
MTTSNELQYQDNTRKGIYMMSQYVGKEVYIKFGKYHATKGTVLRETTKKGEPAFILKTHDNTQIIKRQKNTVIMLPANK